MDVIKLGNVSHSVSMEVLKNKGKAAGACIFMDFGYVALLYTPGLCLPEPKSAQEHMLRRFACFVVTFVLAPFISLMILPVRMFLLLSSPSFVIGNCQIEFASACHHF
jgi:hypothetical protein